MYQVSKRWLLEQLEAKGFSRAKDREGIYAYRADIFFKLACQVNDKSGIFMLFVMASEAKGGRRMVVDVWLDLYEGPQEIGRIQPKNTKWLVSEFDYERHMPFVEKLLTDPEKAKSFYRSGWL
jgi:hypothetical protein